MASGNNLGWTFDTATDVYEKMRPGYATELYDAIFACCHIGADSRVLEVGIGTGQATLPVLKTGCDFTAVEAGENMVKRCRERFWEYPNFRVIAGKFEDVPLEANAYDLVFSATAFHWIPEEIGYRKVFSILRPGGVFARFANRPHPAWDNPALREAMNGVYAKYHYGGERKTPTGFDESQARELAAIPGKYGFSDTQYRLFERVRVMTAEEYVALLATYSDNIALEASVRKAFFAGIAEAIHHHGGVIRIWDTMDLELARKI